ncbi:MAG: hypothetical protein AAF389_03285 [Gemmatimonadota bacterium]
MTNDEQLRALLDEVDAVEARIDALRPTVVGVVGRVGTYFGVLAALSVSLVEPEHVVPWMAITLTVSSIPELRRLMRRRSLTRRRDALLSSPGRESEVVPVPDR